MKVDIFKGTKNIFNPIKFGHFAYEYQAWKDSQSNEGEV